MSLMGTLAKVAIGIAVAKGVGGMMKGGKQPTSSQGGGGLLGDLLKGGLGGSQNTNTQAGGQGGLGDLLGTVLGGKRPGQSGGGTGGGLGDLLEQLGGGMPSGRQGQSGGGLGDLLGQLTKGSTGGGAGGGLGDLMGDFLGKASGNNGPGGSFGEILNDSFSRGGEPQFQPTQDQEAVAALMLKAMVQATKADGKFDNSEQEKLLSNLGDVSQEEKAFVHAELQAPMDVEGLARQVPRGLEQQVYMMSVMAIDLDSQAEAQYLHQLASAMGIGQEQANAIHDQLGVQRLYA